MTYSLKEAIYRFLLKDDDFKAVYKGSSYAYDLRCFVWDFPQIKDFILDKRYIDITYTTINKKLIDLDSLYNEWKAWNS